MGRLMTMILVIFAINVGILLFAGTSPGTTNFYWNFMKGPVEWSTSTLLAFFVLGSGILAGVGIVVGTFFTSSDRILDSGFVAGFISIGAGIYPLWSFINTAVGSYFPTAQGAGSWLIASIFVSPLAFMYLFSVLEWWRLRD